MTKRRRARAAAVWHQRVPILAEEYAVHVYLGTHRAVMDASQRRLTRLGLPHKLERNFNGRGIAWDPLPEHNPIIGVASDLPPVEALATLAHEASHAVGFLAQSLGLDDAKGEFRAHGIGAVLRAVGPTLLARGRRRRPR